MPSKEETSERLHAVLEEVEELPEVDVEPVEEEEVEEETASKDADPNGATRSSSREYIVLISGKDNSWSQVRSPVEATSAEGAIRLLGDLLKDGATYVAVPQRNWNPVPVSIKTTTTISFE